MTGAGVPRDLALDYLAVGHVTADLAPDGAIHPGGTVTYAAATAVALGLRAGIVTAARRGDVDRATADGVARCTVDAPATTTFVNRYDDEGRREQRVLALAPVLAGSDVPPRWRSAGVLHLAPVAREVGGDVTACVAAEFVALTPQGWLRRLVVGEPVRAARWDAPPGLLRGVDAAVVSEEDLAAEAAGAAWLAARVPVLVVTRGAKGADAYAGGRHYHQPACPAIAVDPTGAGDVFAAALFIRLWEGADVPTALRFAAAAAAFAVETPGAGGVPDRNDVEARSTAG